MARIEGNGGRARRRLDGTDRRRRYRAVARLNDVQAESFLTDPSTPTSKIERASRKRVLPAELRTAKVARRFVSGSPDGQPEGDVADGRRSGRGKRRADTKRAFAAMLVRHRAK